MDRQINISRELEELTLLYGSSFGPSLVASLLYGPSGALREKTLDNIERLCLGAEAIKVLAERERMIYEYIYPGLRPSLSFVVSVLSGSKANFPKPEKLDNVLKLRSYAEIRQVLKNKVGKKLDLDPQTAANLASPLDFIKNTNMYSCVDSGSNFLYLIKDGKLCTSVMKKFEIEWNKLNIIQRSKLNSRLLRVAREYWNFWEKDSYDKYKRKYGSKVLQATHFGDLFGMTIIDLNENRGNQRIEELVNLGSKLSFDGKFLVVEDRFEDKRPMRNRNIQGGVDYTLVPRREPNFPIEVRYWTLSDAILNFSGPENWPKYSSTGKKGNPNYKGAR